jgi:hypothetical protein
MVLDHVRISRDLVDLSRPIGFASQRTSLSYRDKKIKHFGTIYMAGGARAVGAASDVGTTAVKESREAAGWFKTADGKLKWGKIAGVGAGGVATWALLDKNAGAKIGGKASDVGGAFGNLFGGAAGGLFGAFLRPEVLVGSCSSCISSVLIAVVFFMMKD